MKNILTSKHVVGIIISILIGVVYVTPHRVLAEGLQIRPLLYNESLGAGEVKKGFVDVSNASDSSVTVALSVEGFKQIDDAGHLQFFPSQDIAAGVLLDLKEVALGPKAAVRVYFLIDSKKLPAGDVLAAIFATTKANGQAGGVTTAARVGTLLVVNNGAGRHQAELTNLQLPLVFFGNNVQGTVDVKNSAPSQQSSAFFPQLTVTIGPVASISKTITGPLVSAGITRKVPFSVPTNRIGFYKVNISTDNGGTISKWVFIMTGWWRLVPFVIIIAVIAALALRKGKKR